MGKAFFRAGRTELGEDTLDEHCHDFYTFEAAKAWLLEELQDGYDEEKLEGYLEASEALKKMNEGNFRFIILNFGWFITYHPSSYNDFLCCLVGGKLDSMTFPNPDKRPGALEMAKRHEQFLKDNNPGVSVYLARITQIL